MNLTTNTTSTQLDRLRNWLVGLTALLVVIPSLINAGIDVYNSLLNIPKSQGEQINSDLFETHFNSHPVLSVPIPIATQYGGSMEMKLSIYKSGDIFAEYGNFSQWFPFPKKELSGLSLIATAHADSPPPPKTKFTQKDRYHEGDIERIRYYEDGTQERLIIDVNTGRIKDKKITKNQGPPPKLKAVPVMEFPTIDLKALAPPKEKKP